MQSHAACQNTDVAKQYVGHRDKQDINEADFNRGTKLSGEDGDYVELESFKVIKNYKNYK